MWVFILPVFDRCTSVLIFCRTCNDILGLIGYCLFVSFVCQRTSCGTWKWLCTCSKNTESFYAVTRQTTRQFLQPVGKKIQGSESKIGNCFISDPDPSDFGTGTPRIQNILYQDSESDI
jgi:hypothetical protein